MKKEEIHLGDIHRWLFGTTPVEFVAEIAIRTVLIYLMLLIAFRLLGKRMNGQVTLVELAVMMTLGAIVSPVMQLPDKGIFYGFVVLVVALLFQRGLNLWAVKNEKIEHTTVGKMSILIEDGIINLAELKKADVSHEQLYAMLREKKIFNIGAVKRAYLEAFGALNIYEEKEPKPGLAIFPTSDSIVDSIMEKATITKKVCCNCGHLQQIQSNDDNCVICQSQDWTIAYLQPKKETADNEA